MKISAIAPWFGSKRQMAPLIVEQLGEHRCYWEPFCGSLAVLLAKPRASLETVCDLHGDLINLALVIQHDRWGPWLYRKARRILLHEEVYGFSKAALSEPSSWEPFTCDPLRLTEEDATRALWFFVNSWLGRNGVIGTKQYNHNFCVRYTTNGGFAGKRWESAVDSIPAWRRRLQGVFILSRKRDGFDLLAKIEDQPGTVIYCDPPYLVKGATYVHDFTSEDHARLAEALSRFRTARVVVSYYQHPRLAELYPSWTVLDCAQTKSLSVQGQRGSKSEKAPEVLLINKLAGTTRQLF